MRHSNLLVIFIVFLMPCKALAQTGDKADHLNRLIRPCLDSLRIVAFDEEAHTICLEALFPAARAKEPTFENFETEGVFSYHTHTNPNLKCYVTEPIAIFDGLRISVVSALSKGSESNYKNIDMETRYHFFSKLEVSQSGEKMIRQTLKMKMFLNQEPTLGFLEAEFWDAKENRPVDIGRPVYRHVLYYKGKRAPGHATHLARDAEGVYSPIEFTEGSDRSFPLFKGGRMGLFVFQIKYMKYPQEAVEANLSGHALITATITAKGKIKDIDFLNDVEPVFRKEAIRLAKKTSGKWIPATRNGEPIEDETTFSLQFDPQYVPVW